MSLLHVAWRATRHHWRTHVPAMAFVALATAIVTGALEVQTSIRSYLWDALVMPLGKVEQATVADGTFQAGPIPEGEVAALALSGTASNEAASATVQATVWGFGLEAGSLLPGLQPVPPGQAFVSPTVAAEIGLRTGSRLFVRMISPNAPPIASVFGRRTAMQSTTEISVEVAGILDPAGMGRFSLTPAIGPKRIIVVDREWIGQQLKIPGRANVILEQHRPELAPGAHTATPAVPMPPADRLKLDDLQFTPVKDAAGFVVRSNRVLLCQGQVTAIERSATRCNATAAPSLVGLADEVTVRGKRISYALAASIGDGHGVRLNAWTAADLHASRGDPIELSFLVPNPDGTFGHRKISSVVADIVPMAGAGVMPELVPDLAGVTDSGRISDWNTPFPIDLSRVSRRDEQYWKQFRTAPKVLLDTATLQSLWGKPGAVTAVLVSGTPIKPFKTDLFTELEPADSGLATIHVLANAKLAATGSSDLAGLVLALSSALIVAALALAVTLLTLNFQSRSRELALMGYLGMPTRVVLTAFALEALIVSFAGAALGTPGGSLLAGLSLAMFSHWMPASASLGHVPVVATFTDALIGAGVGFVCAVAAVLLFARPILSSRRAKKLRRLKPFASPLTSGPGLILRSIRQRPMRLLSVALVVAAGTAVLAVAAASIGVADTNSDGGIQLQVETALPLAIDWTTSAGRRQLRFNEDDEPVFAGVKAYPVLRSAGSDVSCLNPAKPVTPKLAGVDDDFIKSKAFAATAVDGSDAWPRVKSLLNSDAPEVADGDVGIPAIGDGDTLDWILSSGVGKSGEFTLVDGTNVNLHFVGATHGSFLAGYLLVSRDSFRTLFPGIEAPTMFLVKAPPSRVAEVEAALRRNLTDYGVTVRETSAISAELHGVVDAYLSIFMVFGSLGLVLGVCGAALAAVRNALDRRSEVALMLAVGIPRSHVAFWIVAETYLGILLGAVFGLAGAAAVGIAEHVGISVPALAGATLAIVAVSTLACLSVSAMFLRTGVLEALRSE